MSSSQPAPGEQKAPGTDPRAPEPAQTGKGGDPSTAPETWQAAILSRIWRSRHRDKIVLGALCLLPLSVLWSMLTSEIKESTVLGRVIALVGESTAPDLAARQENRPGWFKVIERSDFVDLDTFREVPGHVRDYNVSPTLRETRLRIRKLSPDLTAFFNHSKTTGTTQDLVCLSGQKFEVRKVEPTQEPGIQYLTEFELEIDVAGYETGGTFDLRWQTVGWNKYQGEDDWWTSVVAAYEIETLILTVDFPKEAGISMEDIVVKYRRKPDTSFTTLPIGEQRLRIDGQTGEVRWEIGRAEMGTEYALFWRKSLASSRVE